MRAAFLIASASVALGTGIACASSEDEAVSSPDPGPVARDAAFDAPAIDAAVIEPPLPATCSAAGWCITALPDADLTLIDIWPFKDRAFAVAVSASLGAKVMEWASADQRWTYIDDDTQNENGLGRYVGRIWAPNENEVYYTVEPGYVYHGTRGATWSWERELLLPASIVATGRDLSAPVANGPESAALGVWGTSGDDVYAWRANTIYRRTSVDGGARAWVEDYVPPGAQDRVAILSAGGSTKEDVWFSGANDGDPVASRSSACALLLRRTANGYQAVVRGVRTIVDVPYRHLECVASPGTVALTRPGDETSQDPGAGAFADVQVGADGVIAALWYTSALTRLIPRDGGYVSASETLLKERKLTITLTSLWVQGDDAWLSAPGLVFRGPVAGDASAFGLSSVALTGAPLGKPLYRIRGTDASNLWAIGARYAFHKTAP